MFTQAEETFEFLPAASRLIDIADEIEREKFNSVVEASDVKR
jgi:hypothetical protein